MHNIWTWFAPVGIYYLRCSGLHSFNNNGILNGIILPDFHDFLSTRVLFHSVDNYFHKVLCIMSLKGPYDLLIYKLN